MSTGKVRLTWLAKPFLRRILGFLALLWFLIRVVPKPSRAAYPCQRASFPIASAFVVWLAGLVLSYACFRKTRVLLSSKAFVLGSVFLTLSSIVAGLWIFPISSPIAIADGLADEPVVLRDVAADSAVVIPRSIVAIVRSSKARADDIDSVEIDAMVREAVEKSGGLPAVIHDGSTVIIKPNLIATAWLNNDYLPTGPVLPEKVNAVTTDYRIVQAVVSLVRERNPNGKLYLMEGSGIGRTRDNMAVMGMTKVVGIDDILCLDEACGAWRDRSSPQLVRVSLPPGKALYTAASNTYYLNKIYYEADAVISVPVLKTHCNAAMTGAVKNVGIGATPVNIYGASDDRHWRVDVIDHGGTNFINLHNWIHDFYMCRPVDFAVMDALTGMENGPTPVMSDPVSLRRKNTRCILASRDPLALDAVASLMVQVDPTMVRHLVTLHNDSLGCADPKYIRIVGMRVDEVKDRYSNVATYASYYDYSAPSASIAGYNLGRDTLCLQLNTGTDAVKIEIEIDGSVTGPIYKRPFDDLRIPLGPDVKDLSRVRVLVYDRYLNCTPLDFSTMGAGSANVPSGPMLVTNYPNPFNPSTTIRYSVPSHSYVELEIYDVRGKRIVSVFNGVRQAGTYATVWYGRNTEDVAVSSGVYLCRLTVTDVKNDNKVTQSRKIVLLR